jgi:peroxiredoxin
MYINKNFHPSAMLFTKSYSIIFLTIILFNSISVMAQTAEYEKYGIDISSGLIPKGLHPGDKAPGFTGYDQNGKQVELKKLLENGPVVLFFYRGKWCPVCSKYLDNFQDSLNVITGMGFNVVAITPESIENVEQTVRMHNLTFPVIYDCQEKIMQDYGVIFDVTRAYKDNVSFSYSIDIAQNNGRDKAHLPVPATFIISRDGIITSLFFNPDYKIRASVRWVLQNLTGAL